MGFRYYDWECTCCGHVFAALTWVDSGGDPPRTAVLNCPPCREVGCTAATLCERRISCPAPYMGERQWHPLVAGGSFDTMGVKPVRELPELRDNAEPGEVREHFRTAEFRDAKAERAEQRKVNALKKRRVALQREGKSFNLRRSEDRLPGDPRI